MHTFIYSIVQIEKSPEHEKKKDEAAKQWEEASMKALEKEEEMEKVAAVIVDHANQGDRLNAVKAGQHKKNVTLASDSELWKGWSKNSSTLAEPEKCASKTCIVTRVHIVGFIDKT